MAIEVRDGPKMTQGDSTRANYEFFTNQVYTYMYIYIYTCIYEDSQFDLYEKIVVFPISSISILLCFIKLTVQYRPDVHMIISNSIKTLIRAFNFSKL